MSAPLVIDGPDALRRLAATPMLAIRDTPVVLDLRLPPPEQAAWEARLDRLYRACGCGTGAIVALLLASAYTAILLSFGLGDRLGAWTALAGGLGVVGLGAAAGKVAALAWARRRLKRGTAELLARLEADASRGG